MATNPYSYGSLGARWTVGEPTSKSLLDISRVKNDANRWTLEQLIPDPDTTQTLGFDLSFNSSDQRLLQIYNTDASNYFQIFGGRAASPTSDHLVFSTGTNGTIMEFDGANHWITFHDTAGVQKMYYRGDGSPGLILESGVDLTVGGTISGSTGLYTSTLATSAGDIGVGTHSPSGLGARTLNIKAASSAGADLTIEADNGTNFGVFYSGATTNDPFSIFSNTGFKFAIASDKNATGFDEALRIKSDGNVGFNETSPDTIIHATQGGEPPAEGMLILEANSSSRQLRIQPPTNADNGFFDARGGNMTFLDDGTEIWRYNASTFSTSSGINVGIGTTSPTAPLEVYASATTAQNAAIVIDGPVNNYEGVQYRVGGVDVGYTAQEATGRMYHGAGIEHRFRTGSGSVVGGTDALTIDSSQRVGIGTSSPQLRVSTEVQLGGSDGFGVQYSNETKGELTVNPSTGEVRMGATNSTGTYFTTLYSNGSERARIDSSGNLLIGYTSSNGSYKLQVNSQIFATNATIATSDGRYKEDVQTLSNATNLVSRLNPVQFKWKAHEIHNLDVGKTDVGFIAQEVQEVLSDTDYSDSVVVTNKVDDEKYLGLGETKLIPLLTAALQEAIAKIETLETKVAALEAA